MLRSMLELAPCLAESRGVPANMLPRSTAEAFDQLKWLLDSEGKNLAGPDGLGILANVGLVASQPFKPDAEKRERCSMPRRKQATK